MSDAVSDHVQMVGVCGFPRSGSSLTMRMLHAGGIPPVTGSSPGSYELSGGLEQLASMPPRQLAGRAVKLLDYGQWFPYLPAGIDWRFIWLDRNPTEQAKSTVKFMSFLMPGMLRRDRGAIRRLAKSYRSDRPRLLGWYRSRGDVLVSSFEAILADPSAEAARFAEFLPTLDAVAAAEVPLTRSAACAADLAVEIALARTT